MESVSESGYDPYQFRTNGHISNLAAFLHLVKCAFGLGVLTFPHGFKDVGMLLGFVIGGAVSTFCVYCFHLLIRNMVRIAAIQETPYVSFADSVKYSLTHNKKTTFMAKYSGRFIDLMTAAYHFGICVAYINYLTIASLMITNNGRFATGSVNFIRTMVTLIWVIALYLVNCLRNLKTLMPISLIGNITTFGAIAVILFFILRPDAEGFSNDWEVFGSVTSIPLYIGIILFAVESFGVIVVVEKDMKTPKKFLGTVGIFNFAMLVVVVWYLFIGGLGYLKYGQDTQPTIAQCSPTTSCVAVGLQMVAVYCSYPLQCNVIFSIYWGDYIEPKLKTRKLFWDFMFRLGVTVLTGVICLVVPRLDLIISLTGSFCLSLLGIVIPGLLDYNYYLSTSQWTKPWVMTRDLVIIFLGCLAFIIGTYSSIYGLVKESLAGNPTGSRYLV